MAPMPCDAPILAACSAKARLDFTQQLPTCTITLKPSGLLHPTLGQVHALFVGQHIAPRPRRAVDKYTLQPVLSSILA